MRLVCLFDLPTMAVDFKSESPQHFAMNKNRNIVVDASESLCCPVLQSDKKQGQRGRNNTTSVVLS